MDFAQSLKSAFEAHAAAQIQIRGPISPAEHEPIIWSLQNRKTYPRLPKIKFLGQEAAGSGTTDAALADVLRQRASCRDFSNRPLKFEALGYLLASTAMARAGAMVGIRPYPSAGARYPLEVYVGAGNVEPIPNGLYHYDAVEHHLTVLETSDALAAASRLTGTSIVNADVVIYLTGALHRTCVKYGGRGYRYALIEAGALAQNICLMAAGLGLGSFLIGGFDDELVCDYLDVSPELELEYPLVIIIIGATTA